MDSILITPKNEKEQQYIIELMKNIGAMYKVVDKEATEEFEMALMIKDINTAGVIREGRNATHLSEDELIALKKSENDLESKRIIPEPIIQNHEDLWLKQ